MSYQTNKVAIQPVEPATPTIDSIAVGQMFQLGNHTRDDNVYMKIASGAHNAVNLKFGSVFSIQKDRPLEAITGRVTIG